MNDTRQVTMFDPHGPLESGITLIQASAGTGKTYTIEWLVVRLLMGDGVGAEPPGIERLLIVTYTRAAAAELKDRIRKRIRAAHDGLRALGEGQTPGAPAPEEIQGDSALMVFLGKRGIMELIARGPQGAEEWEARQKAIVEGSEEEQYLRHAQRRLKEALLDFDKASISTIHSFCESAIRQYAFESGSSGDAELAHSIDSLVDGVAEDFWTATLHAAEPWVVALMAEDSPAYKATGRDTSLSALFQKVLRNADLELVPKHELSLDQAIGSFRQLAHDLNNTWRQPVGGGTALEALGERLVVMVENKLLNGNRYRKNSVPEWVEALENWLAEDTLGPPPAHIARFSPDFIIERAATGKETQVEAHLNESPPAVLALIEQLAAVLEARLNIKRAFLHQAIEFSRVEIPRRKNKQNVQTFDDLLTVLRDALRQESGTSGALVQALRAEYQVALIDEFQDTDPVQWEIFETVFGKSDTGHQLFLIGDPKQAIYAFRGGDIFTYLTAARQASKQTTLPTNWRSNERLVQALNAFFVRPHASPAKESNWSPFLARGIDFYPVKAAPQALPGEGSPLELTITDAGRNGALEDVAHQISGLIGSEWKEGEMPPPSGEAAKSGEKQAIRAGDIAVLVHAGHHATKMQGLLAEYGIASVLTDRRDVFESREGGQLEALFVGLLELNRQERVHALLCTELAGMGAPDLLRLDHDEIAANLVYEKLAEWAKTWKERGVAALLQTVLAEPLVLSPGEPAPIAPLARILAMPQGERRMTNYLHLIELLGREAQRNQWSPEALLHWLQRRRKGEDDEDGVGEEAELRMESDDDAVKIMTIHKSKGLEFPIVFCPTLGEQSKAGKPPLEIHVESAGETQTQVVLTPTAEDLGQYRGEAIAEQVRLIYVALTRARHRCYAYWYPSDGPSYSAMTWLMLREFPKLQDNDRKAVNKIVKGIISAFSKELEFDELELIEDLSTPGQGIALRQLPDWDEEEEASSESSPNDHAKKPLADARSYSRPAWKRWWQSSFTSLSKGRREASEIEGQGYDETEGDSPPDPQEPRKPKDAAKQKLPRSGKLTDDVQARGAEFGNLVHSLFEEMEFSLWKGDSYDTEELAKIEGRAGRRLGAPAKGKDAPGLQAENTDLTALQGVLWNTLRTPLVPEDENDGRTQFRLADISDEKKLVELEFLFPISQGEGDSRWSEQGLQAGKLAGTLRKYGEGAYDRLADKVEAMKIWGLRGYMKGLIDLIFEHEGRWYIADYKTNSLGDYKKTTYEDYLPKRVEDAMVSNSYQLQYLIYTVALARHARLRNSEWTYKKDFGGVYYLFVRGMHPDNGTQSGVYFRKPPAELMRKLEIAMTGSETGGVWE